jgi:hypothetical protein
MVTNSGNQSNQAQLQEVGRGDLAMVLNFEFEVDDLAPNVISAAWLCFDKEKRPALWPALSSTWYEPYEVGEDWAEVREGQDTMGGIWARERYEWQDGGDGGMYIKSTVLDTKKMIKVGGTVEVWISPRKDGQPGTLVRMRHDRISTTGLQGKIMGLMMRLLHKQIFGQSFKKSWQAIRVNCREILGLNPDGTPNS